MIYLFPLCLVSTEQAAAVKKSSWLEVLCLVENWLKSRASDRQVSDLSILISPSTTSAPAGTLRSRRIGNTPLFLSFVVWSLSLWSLVLNEKDGETISKQWETSFTAAPVALWPRLSVIFQPLLLHLN